MDPGEDVASLLATLGISGSSNADGETVYSISQLKNDHNNNAPAPRAIFDAASRCWRVVPQEKAQSNYDWTETLPDSDHVRFLKSVDWRSSPLGPMCDWSLTLQQSVHMMLADKRPTSLQWVSWPVRLCSAWTDLWPNR